VCHRGARAPQPMETKMPFKNDHEPLRSRLKVEQTQEQAAEILGVSKRTWQDWERGINAMPPYALKLYRHVVGLERIPFRAVAS